MLGIRITDYAKGEGKQLLNLGKIKISPSICYEIAFIELVRKTAKDSNILVTISNDTWFGTSLGPYQHLEIAQNRAIEHQKSLIRSTNSGISAIINNRGKILNKQDYFEEKVLSEKVVLYKGSTPFGIVGNLPIYLYLLVIFVYSILNKRTYVIL